MKKAKLIDIFSPDIDDLRLYKPDDSENFCILLQLTVGIIDDTSEKKSGDTFYIEVYTPKWLLSKYKKNEIFTPKNALIAFSYNFERIYQKIKNLVETCYGDSWEEIAKMIGKFAAWEFEDYQVEH